MFSVINNYIQGRLQRENLEEVSVNDAAKWVADENILKNSVTSPGFPLRRNIKTGNIFGAYQKRNYFWYIRRIKDYENIISVREFKQLFHLKSRTSIYRKIDINQIPKKKTESGRIYFSVSELVKWSIEKKNHRLLSKLRLISSKFEGKGELQD
jgi:predicted DNA-binding transcriptional regulator AlpA